MTLTGCATVVACTLAAFAPTAAGARAPTRTSPAHGSEQISIPAHFSGLLTVQFHGDGAAGCARWGLCGYSGTVTWRPPPSGSVQIDVTGGRHPTTSAALLPTTTFGPAPAAGVTTADVQLAGGGPSAPAVRCVDAAVTGAVTGFPAHHGLVLVSLRQVEPALLVTRCAGPRDPDVIPQLPAPVLSLPALERGQRTISFAVSSTLLSHGLIGSISSTLSLHLGRPHRATSSNRSPGRGGTRVRELEVEYRAAITGSVAEYIRGATNPLVCGPLGACGLTGTITLAPRVRDIKVHVIAQERATKPARNLLAAVGLAPGPSRGVAAFGAGAWAVGGSVRAELMQGSERCDDAAPLGFGTLLVGSTRGGLGLVYGLGTSSGASPSVTDCPGPLPFTTVPALGTVPLSVLRGRTTRVTLGRGSSTSDDGYDIRFVPHLTVTLTRVKARTRIVRQPGGFLF
ncbi:MAG: hypothetical protein WAU75_19135 [Solirubrobacteraceae bacterium]